MPVGLWLVDVRSWLGGAYFFYGGVEERVSFLGDSGPLLEWWEDAGEVRQGEEAAELASTAQFRT